MKLTDWTPSADISLTIVGGAVTIQTHRAKFRFTLRSGRIVEKDLVAFKHDASNTVWVGPKSTHYALIAAGIIAFDAPDRFGSLPIGESLYSHKKVVAGTSTTAIFTGFEAEDNIASERDISRSIPFRSLLGSDTDFFSGEPSSNPIVPLAIIKVISIVEPEVKIEIQGFTPAD